MLKGCIMSTYIFFFLGGDEEKLQLRKGFLPVLHELNMKNKHNQTYLNVNNNVCDKHGVYVCMV